MPPKKNPADLFKKLAAEQAPLEAKTEATAETVKDKSDKKPGGKRGGKRSNSDYQQIGAYLPKEVHRQVMKRLAAEDGELSALLEALLKNWLGE
jgi:hypothetical protein